MLTETILRWVIEYGYLVIFSVLALGIIGAPIPDEALLAFAGYLVYNGQLQLVPTVVTAFLGSVCGITLSYGLGRTIGNYLITKFGPAVQITGDKVIYVQTWFERVGKWGLLFGYYLPGVRHLIAFVLAYQNSLSPCSLCLHLQEVSFGRSPLFPPVTF